MTRAARIEEAARALLDALRTGADHRGRLRRPSKVCVDAARQALNAALALPADGGCAAADRKIAARAKGSP